MVWQTGCRRDGLCGLARLANPLLAALTCVASSSLYAVRVRSDPGNQLVNLSLEWDEGDCFDSLVAGSVQHAVYRDINNRCPFSLWIASEQHRQLSNVGSPFFLRSYFRYDSDLGTCSLP